MVEEEQAEVEAVEAVAAVEETVEEAWAAGARGLVVTEKPMAEVEGAQVHQQAQTAVGGVAEAKAAGAA